MKTTITFIPAEFRAGSKGYTFAIPYTAIHKGEYEVKNLDALKTLVASLADKFNKKDAIISIRPLNRKVNGFDKWDKAAAWNELQVHAA